MSTYQFVVQKGPQEGQTYPLSKDNMTVGRDPMCDIVINDPEISRQHARLTQTGAGYQLQDLGSTNGSFVEGKRLAGEAVLLTSGQIVKMGSAVTLRYEVFGSDPMATVLSPNILADLSMPTESELKKPPKGEPAPSFAAPTAQPAYDEPAPLPAYDSFSSYEPPADQRTMLDSDLPSFGSSSSSSNDLPSFDSSSTSSSSSSVPVFTPQMTGGTPPSSPSPASDGGAPRNNRNIIIAVVVVVLLCCCCITLGLLYQYGDAIMAQLGMAPKVLPFLTTLV